MQTARNTTAVIPFLKIQQSNKISILETVELVRESAQLISDVSGAVNNLYGLRS